MQTATSVISVSVLASALVTSCTAGSAGDPNCAEAITALSLSSAGSASHCQGSGCACDQRLPSGWPKWQLYENNPVLVASTTGEKSFWRQGQDNVYAPAILKSGPNYLMWYGAEGADLHDRIYFAWSKDSYNWQKWPTGQSPEPALDVGSSEHVNDPSVVFTAGEYYVYYVSCL